jgi:phosphatidylserine/phosphatidylglycerophosphate/cardiolipin synthase-like enzyme
MGVLADAITAALGRQICIDIMTTRSNLELSVFHELARAYRRQIRLFHPAFPFAEISELGSHAKFCISDEEAAYIGSANLTASALGGADAASPHSRQHFEMGVLVRGQVAAQLYQFWAYTVRYGIFVEYGSTRAIR